MTDKVQAINKKKAAIQREANGNAGHPFWERNPWKNTKKMKNDAIAALKSITGGKENNHLKWRSWWKENQKELFSGASKTYWFWASHEREAIGIREKSPKESVLVGIRIVEKKKEKESK